MEENKPTEKPGYYAIIPAIVRYDKRLSPNAKLLYGEITCLLQFNNKCFASNNYFARLYEVSEVQISRLVSQLVNAGYIITDVENTSIGSRRLIRLSLINFDNTPKIKSDGGGLNKKVKHNNHSVKQNSLSNDKERALKKFIPPSIEDVHSYFKEKGFTAEAAQKAFDYYDVAEWKDSSGKPVKNWKQKMISVWFKKENKIQSQSPSQKITL